MPTLVRGEEKDFPAYYALKCERSAIVYGGFSSPPDPEKLKAHYLKLIHGQIENVDFYHIKDDEGTVVGYLQLTRIGEKEIEFANGVSEAYRGKGYGSFAVQNAIEIGRKIDPEMRVIAYILEENIISQKNIERHGYVRSDQYIERWIPLLGGMKKMWLYVPKGE